MHLKFRMETVHKHAVRSAP